MRNENLRNARLQAGLSQIDLAEMAEISRRSYQRYEYGNYLPDVPVANRLCRILHVPYEELFGSFLYRPEKTG